MRPETPGYQLFILTLSLYALGALAAIVLIDLEPETRRVLDYADFAVCGFFLVDFAICFIRASNRLHYLLTWGWLDLLSSIPVLDPMRWGRAARLTRIVRVLRGLRATGLLLKLIATRRAENAGLAAALITLLLVVFCSIAVLHFETSPESNIRTAEDALWWAVATVTTVGYGDRFPVTSEGRLVGGILMFAGVGLVGTLAGFLAAWFLAPRTVARSNEPSQGD